MLSSERQTENCPYDRQDSFPETDRKLSGNKKEIKKNDLSKRENQEEMTRLSTNTATPENTRWEKLLL